MPFDDAEPILFADTKGIHLPAVNGFVVVDWGEIAQVEALLERYQDGTAFIDVMVIHISDVDFHFHSTDRGYEQTAAEMEKRLFGFRRDKLESVHTFEDAGGTIPVIWKRGEAL